MRFDDGGEPGTNVTVRIAREEQRLAETRKFMLTRERIRVKVSFLANSTATSVTSDSDSFNKPSTSKKDHGSR